MGIWIALLITLAVLGSVMWVMPSRRDKMLIEMRQKAMALGLKVRLLDQKLAGKLFPWLDDYRGYVLYERYFPIGHTPKEYPPQAVRLTVDDTVHELDLDKPVLRFLEASGLVAKLPASAEALFLFSGGAAILWREQEGIAAVAEIDDCLARCLKATTLWQPSVTGRAKI